MNGKILITARSFRKAEGPHKEILRGAGYELVECPNEHPLAATELAGWMADIDAAILGLDTVTEEVFAAAGRLRVISRYGVGVDAVDVAAATRHGVVVTITPGANSVAVAELAIALLMALARSIPYHDRASKQGNWSRVQGMELSGATMGIVGLGRIGREVAQRAACPGHAGPCLRPVCDAREPRRDAGGRVQPGRTAGGQRRGQPAPSADPGTRDLIDAASARTHEAFRLSYQHRTGGIAWTSRRCTRLCQGSVWPARRAMCSSRSRPTRAGWCRWRTSSRRRTSGSATHQTTLRMGLMAAENALAVLRGERPAGVVNPEVYDRE